MGNEKETIEDWMLRQSKDAIQKTKDRCFVSGTGVIHPRDIIETIKNKMKKSEEVYITAIASCPNCLSFNKYTIFNKETISTCIYCTKNFIIDLTFNKEKS